MTPRASHSLVAALIRIGLLLALVIMLMAENAQAQRNAQPMNTQRVSVASHDRVHLLPVPGPALRNP
jgi:type III secretory pathway component EscT